MYRLIIAMIVAATSLAFTPTVSVAGTCDCAWQTDSAGRRCGKRAASEKPGGANPMCDQGGQEGEQSPAVNPAQERRRQSGVVVELGPAPETSGSTVSIENPFAEAEARP